jgi:TetR/AcrR family transcriptional regulator
MALRGSEKGGRSPRWRRLPEQRPGQILEAALEVFGEQGLAGARLEEIAARAGVSKGTIYLYFPNKDELFREMVRQRVGRAVAGLTSAVGEGGTASEQLRRMMEVLWRYLRDPEFECIYRLVIGELHQFPDLARFYSEEVSGRVTRVLADVIERGVAEREFGEVDPEVAARMLAALLNKHAVWCGRREIFSQLVPATDEQVLHEIGQFYFRALRPGGRRGQR